MRMFSLFKNLKSNGVVDPFDIMHDAKVDYYLRNWNLEAKKSNELEKQVDELKNQIKKIENDHFEILSKLITEDKTGYIRVYGKIVEINVDCVEVNLDTYEFMGCGTGNFNFNPSSLIDGSSQ